MTREKFTDMRQGTDSRPAPAPAPDPARPLRIAYLCDISPLDRNLYSGGNARIHDALRRHAGEVTILPVTWGMAEPARRLIHALPEVANLRMRWRTHLALSRLTGAAVRRALAR